MVRVVIYARLSRTEHELSLARQITLLKDYAQRQGWTVQQVYCDAGFSGGNLMRPAWQQLWRDAQAQRFDILLIKDLSRLGRNLVQVGTWLEQILPAQNIRVIAVNDGYDSAQTTDDQSWVIKNFLNAFYLQEYKKKAHRALQQRIQTQHLNYYPKYGYRFDAQGQEQIDPYAASIVRWIFRLAASGQSTGQIAHQLNTRQVLSRSQYATQVLRLPALHRQPATQWQASQVWAILKDYEYCGHAINLVRQAQPVVLRQQHLALISETLFRQANQHLQQRPRRTVNPTTVVLRDANTKRQLRLLTRRGRTYFSGPKQAYQLAATTLQTLLWQDLQAVLLAEHEAHKMATPTVSERWQTLFESYTQGKITAATYQAKIAALRLLTTTNKQQAFADVTSQKRLLQQAIVQVLITPGTTPTQFTVQITYRFMPLNAAKQVRHKNTKTALLPKENTFLPS